MAVSVDFPFFVSGAVQVAAPVHYSWPSILPGKILRALLAMAEDNVNVSCTEMKLINVDRMEDVRSMTTSTNTDVTANAVICFNE